MKIIVLSNFIEYRVVGCDTQIHWTDRKNWTNDGTVLLGTAQGYSSRELFTRISRSRHQLFCLRFGREFILFVGSSKVWVSQKTNICRYCWDSIVFFRLPFNWKCPVGYLIIASFEYLEVLFACEIVCLVLCFLIGSCYLLESFINDISNEICSLNAEGQKTKSNGNKLAINERTILCNAVQHHSDLKQLSATIAWYIATSYIYCSNEATDAEMEYLFIQKKSDLLVKWTRSMSSFSHLSLYGIY